jgi:ABC-type amino acid transport substrate-binding protein
MPFVVRATIALTLLTVIGINDLQAREQRLPNRTIVVGTKEAPPFAFKSDESTWKGISIDLWRDIASELNLTFEFRESDLEGLLDGVANRSLDVAVAAITMTSEREKFCDFTHPFYRTGLGIAAVSKQESTWLALIDHLFSGTVVRVAFGLGVLLLIVGFLIWAFERKRNPAHFGGSTAKGLGSGFWWSAVTMTTVGYGDKVPVTIWGRLVALFWMFGSLILVSFFIGTITASLTVSKLELSIRGVNDLPKVIVGTVAHTTSESYLREHRLTFLVYPTAEEGLQALVNDNVAAFVYDEPMLRYLVNKDFKGKLAVLDSSFDSQDYAIALQTGSPLREPINRVLLKKINEDMWQDTLYEYLGQ